MSSSCTVVTVFPPPVLCSTSGALIGSNEPLWGINERACVMNQSRDVSTRLLQNPVWLTFDCCRDTSGINGAERVYELRPLQMFMWKNLKANWVGKRRKLEEMRGVIAKMTRSYDCGRWRSRAISCDREIPFSARDWQRQKIDTNDLFSLSSWVLSLREWFPGRAAENKGLCIWADVTLMLRSSDPT